MKTKVEDTTAKIDKIINCLLKTEEENIGSDDDNTIGHIEALIAVCDTAVNGNNGKELLENASFLRKLDQVDEIIDGFQYPAYLSLDQNGRAKQTELRSFDIDRAAQAPWPAPSTQENYDAPDKGEDYHTCEKTSLAHR